MNRYQFIIIFFSLLQIQFVSSQTIEEGKGIDSIKIGIKESKVTKFLGTNYVRKDIEDNEYTLNYSKNALTVSFDKDSVVYEISIKPTIKRQTSKGLQITPELKISDIEKVYGDESWYTFNDTIINQGYDSGITFRVKNNKKITAIDPLFIESKVTEIIIEQSENDYSFQEYIDGVFIPKNLTECFNEIDHFFKQSDKESIKSKTESEFTGGSHFSLGIWMRNNWALWKGSRLSKYFNEMEIFHPDDMSGIILTSYYRFLLGKDIQLQKQVDYYKIYWKVNKKPLKEIYPSNVKKNIEFNTSQSYNLKENENPGCVHIQTNSKSEKLWIYDFYFGWKLISQKELIKLNKTDYDTREQTLREIFNVK